MHLMRFVTLVVMFIYGNLYANIDTLFEHIDSANPESGLALEIAIKEPFVDANEPTDVYVRFRNVTKTSMAIPICGDKQSNIGLGLQVSYLDVPHMTFRQEAAAGEIILIPPEKSVYIVLTNIVFTKDGKADISLQYKHIPPENVPARDIYLWKGLVKSNKVTVVVKKNDDRIVEEKVQHIEKEAKHLLDLMAKDPFNETHNYHWESTTYLLENAPEIVPFILANLKDPNESVRRHLLSTLRTIVRKERLGPKSRSTALMEDIIKDISSKQSIYKGYGIGILTDLYEVYSDNKQEDRQRIAQAFKRVINNTDDRRLRAGATIGLIRINPVDGYREAFKDNRIDDNPYRINGSGEKNAFYDQNGWREVVGAIVKTASLSNMTSINKMTEWWEQNKDRLEAEQVAADAVGTKNQNK